MPSEAGLCSYIQTIVAHIDKAVSNNWIPVVDMKNYYNSYLTNDEVGYVNSWEYYSNSLEELL